MVNNKSTYTWIDLSSPEYTAMLSAAPLYEKCVYVKARRAEAGEVIVTIVKSKNEQLEETRNVAGDGDYIVTNPGGEEYIVSLKKFADSYKAHPDGRYQSIGIVRAFQIHENVEFTAPWGDIMRIRQGGYLVENDGDRYGIEEEVFQETYKLKV